MHVADPYTGIFGGADTHPFALKLILDTPRSDNTVVMGFDSDGSVVRRGFQLQFRWQRSSKRII